MQMEVDNMPLELSHEMIELVSGGIIKEVGDGIAWALRKLTEIATNPNTTIITCGGNSTCTITVNNGK